MIKRAVEELVSTALSFGARECLLISSFAGAWARRCNEAGPNEVLVRLSKDEMVDLVGDVFYGNPMPYGGQSVRARNRPERVDGLC